MQSFLTDALLLEMKINIVIMKDKPENKIVWCLVIKLIFVQNYTDFRGAVIVVLTEFIIWLDVKKNNMFCNSCCLLYILLTYLLAVIFYSGKLSECCIGWVYTGNFVTIPELDSTRIHIWNEADPDAVQRELMCVVCKCSHCGHSYRLLWLRT